MKVHHLGIIVKNINEELELYCKIGYVQLTKVYIDEYQKNKVVFLKKGDMELLIELIEPFGTDSTVRSAPTGYHHICYEVNSDNEIDDMLGKSGVGKVFMKKKNAIALDNRKVSFAMLKNGIIIEFLHG